MHVFLSIFLSLFPPRYRNALARKTIAVGNEGAFLSGLAEFFLSLCLLVAYYFIFTGRFMHGIPDQALLQGAKKMGDTGVMGFGMIVLLAYLTSPVTLILIYFLIEGCVRALAAWVTNEIIPTLPLQLVASLHRLVERTVAEFKLGKRIPDEVQQ